MIQRINKVVLVFAVLAVLALSVPAAVSLAKPDLPLAAETIENIARLLWLDEIDGTGFDDALIQRLASPENSPAAFGERMRRRLDGMLTNPDSCTPDYSPRYNIMKQYETVLSPHQAYAQNMILGPTSSRDYQPLPKQKTFIFPLDDRPQFEYQVGWHFFVGSVFDGKGQEYGVQLMFWRYSLLPPPLARALDLSDLENQVVEMHFAISKAGERHHRAKPYIVAGSTGLIDFSAAPFNYQVGKNYMRSLGADKLFPLELRAWGVDESGESPVEIEIDITLDQAKGYVLNGDKGLAPSCGGVGTLYYSVTNLRIDPCKSTLKINGRRARLTSGKMWYDHQWGTGFMPTGNPRSDVIRAFSNLSPRKPGGWEWIMIQLDDETEIALSALHTNQNINFYNQTGLEPPGVMTASAVGEYIRRDGSHSSISGDIQVTEWVKSTITYGQYEATNLWYPNRVEITLDDDAVPLNYSRLTLEPIVSTGQQGFFAGGSQYSEGAVYVHTPYGGIVGRGFLESTGYGDSRRQVLLLGGMPAAEDMIQLLTPPELTPEAATQCREFLADPVNAARLLHELGECKGL